MARTLVTGGVRSGKSRYAETLLSPTAPVTYLSPGYPADPTHDPEWAERVVAHRTRRAPAWRTVETLALTDGIRGAEGPVLVDCLGTWVTRLLDSWDAWDQPHAPWLPRFEAEVEALAAAVSGKAGDLVIVTNEVGWGLVSEYRSGRIFVDLLGRTNAKVAAACDTVVLMVAGRPLVLPAEPET